MTRPAHGDSIKCDPPDRQLIDAAPPAAHRRPSMPRSPHDFQLPASGQRLSLGSIPGSGDAWLVARFAASPAPPAARGAVRRRGGAATSADEIPLFAPGLRVHCCRTGKPCRTTSSRRTRTWSPNAWRRCTRVARRVRRAARGRHDRVVAAGAAVVSRRATRSSSAGRTLDEGRLRSQLTLAGYQHVTQVMSPGEYSVRGGLIDLFPMGSRCPTGSTCSATTSKRSARSTSTPSARCIRCKEVRLLPGREFPMDEAARAAFRDRWRETFEGDPSKSAVYKDIGSGIPPPASSTTCRCSSTRPRRCSTIFRDDAVIVIVGDASDALKRFWHDTESRYRFRRRQGATAAAAERTVHDVEEFFAGRIRRVTST